MKYFLPVYKLRIKQPQHILGITSSFASNNYGSWYPEQKFAKMQMLPKKKKSAPARDDLLYIKKSKKLQGVRLWIDGYDAACIHHKHFSQPSSIQTAHSEV